MKIGFVGTGHIAAPMARFLAGKGHERTQTIGTEKLPFDEAAIAREAWAARGAA